MANAVSNLEWNKKMWDDPQKWASEWNSGYAWGGRPMVERDFARFMVPYMPHNRKPRVLEIACGMGRFTELLLEHCESVHAVDLAEHCVNSCRERFADRGNFSAELTDGKTLPEGQFDMVVSYDSLVHADFGVLEAYFTQAQERLVPGGCVCIHHANRADPPSSRMNVTGKMVFDLVEKLPKLTMVSQTLFRFTEGSFVDCFTVAKRNAD